MESDRVKAIDSTFTAKDKDLHKAEAKELSQSPSENVSAGLKEKNTTRRYSVPSYHVNWRHLVKAASHTKLIL